MCVLASYHPVKGKSSTSVCVCVCVCVMSTFLCTPDWVSVQLFCLIFVSQATARYLAGGGGWAEGAGCGNYADWRAVLSSK